MRSYLAAELVRARGSALQWLPLLAVPLVFLTYNFSRFASPALDATGVLMWQAMYVTGMAAPLIAIFAATAEAREQKARGGGTLWLPISMRRVRLARYLVVVLSIAGFHVLNFGGTYLVTVLAGRENGGPIVTAGAYCFIGSLGVAGLAAACARLSNLIITLVLFIGWQLIGILPSVPESTHWWAWPMAWPVRLVLPVLRIHQNGVPLESTDPLLHESPIPALALCLVLAALGCSAAVFTHPIRLLPRRPQIRFSVATPAHPNYVSTAVQRGTINFSHAFWGVSRAIFALPLRWCLTLTALTLCLVAAAYPASYVHGVFTFGLLPIGSGVLATLLWPTLSNAWAVMHAENPYSTRALLLWILHLNAMVSLFAGAAGLAAGGGTWEDEVRRCVLSTLVGTIISISSLILTVWLGSSVAIAFSVIFAIVSLTLGGDILANTPLWLMAMPAWADTATTPARLAVALGIGAVLLPSTWLIAKRLLSRWVFTFL